MSIVQTYSYCDVYGCVKHPILGHKPACTAVVITVALNHAFSQMFLCLLVVEQMEIMIESSYKS